MFRRLDLITFVVLLCGINVLEAQNCSVNVKLRGVYDATLSISKFENGRYGEAIQTVSEVRNDAFLTVPADKLPGQFLLRMDYRQKVTDNPYPSEFVFFVNKDNISLGINPMVTRADSVTFENDSENPVYYSFMRENALRRQQLALVGQLLEGYENRSGRFYRDAITEFDRLRDNYNTWIDQQISLNSGTLVSRLFAFQKVPAKRWTASVTEQLDDQRKNYFNYIDFEDDQQLHFQAFSDFMNNYMAMYGMQATNEALRDSLFTEAGRMACSRFSSAHPKLYGWIVDYFYRGFETYNITTGISMLQQFINDPNCLTSKKQEILKRLEGMQKIKEGSVAPSFEAEMIDGIKLRFDGVSKQKKYELLVFYESTCSHCNDFLVKLSEWYKVPENSIWFDVITISMDDNRSNWELSFQKNKFPWHDVWAPGGVNSKVANDYYILSTPVVFIIDKEMRIQSMPVDLEGIRRFLNE